MILNTVALDDYLAPLTLWLHNKSVSEILINQPGIVFVEENGMFKKYQQPQLTIRHLHGLANLIARFTGQHLNEKTPLLSGQLPDGNRVQIILPPATKTNGLILSIRKQTLVNIQLDG